MKKQTETKTSLISQFNIEIPKASDDVEYKDWTIEFYPVPLQCDPILGLKHCYMATHKDFDGPEDDRCFTAGSVAECIEIIDSEYEM